MGYLVKVEQIDGTFIHLISEFSQTICSQRKSEQSFDFSLKQIYALGESFQVRSIWTFVP